jgi:dTDP-4-amino-4,6-dideoxygalactose transaminase
MYDSFHKDNKVENKGIQMCKELSGLKYWQFTNCCTDSLQLAIYTLTSPGDTILVPAYGWKGVANAVYYMGRTIEFVDVDGSGCISLEELERKFKLMPRRFSAVIVIHMFGTVVDCKKVRNIVGNIPIIEDCAQSFIMGEPYSYIPGTSSDIVCYSFDFVKSPGTLGSGGAIATNNPLIAEQLEITLSHGEKKQGDDVLYGTKSYMDITSIAVLLTDILITQQFKLREKKVEIATWYKENLPFPCLPGENYIYSKYMISIPSELRILLKKQLKSQGLHVDSMYDKPLPCYNYNIKNYFYNTAIDLGQTTIRLPCHEYLTIEELERIKTGLTI